MTYIDYHERYAKQIVTLWRASKRKALGSYREPHDFQSMMSYLTHVMSKTHHIKLAVVESIEKVVGFMAVHEGCVDQLYIDISHQGQGIGTALLTQAKSLYPDNMHLCLGCVCPNLYAAQKGTQEKVA